MASKGGKRGGTKEKAMDKKASRKLTETELEQRRVRFQKKYSVLRGLEKRRAKLVREMNSEIKVERMELDALHEEIESGMEMLAQGDMFADGGSKAADAVPQDVAVTALSEVAARAKTTH